MIPDDAAGRPLSPTELSTIADLERRLLLDAPPARHGDPGRRRAWYWSATGVPLAALLGAGGVLLIVAALVGGGLLGAVAVLASVVVTAFVWPLLPPTLGGPRRSRRLARRARPR